MSDYFDCKSQWSIFFILSSKGMQRVLKLIIDRFLLSYWSRSLEIMNNKHYVRKRCISLLLSRMLWYTSLENCRCKIYAEKSPKKTPTKGKKQPQTPLDDVLCLLRSAGRLTTLPQGATLWGKEEIHHQSLLLTRVTQCIHRNSLNTFQPWICCHHIN